MKPFRHSLPLPASQGIVILGLVSSFYFAFYHQSSRSLVLPHDRCTTTILQKPPAGVFFLPTAHHTQVRIFERCRTSPYHVLFFMNSSASQTRCSFFFNVFFFFFGIPWFRLFFSLHYTLSRAVRSIVIVSPITPPSLSLFLRAYQPTCFPISFQMVLTQPKSSTEHTPRRSNPGLQPAALPPNFFMPRHNKSRS